MKTPGTILRALRNLTETSEPHPCGGFNLDDLRQELRSCRETDEELLELIDELIAEKLIRFAGEDFTESTPACFELY